MWYIHIGGGFISERTTLVQAFERSASGDGVKVTVAGRANGQPAFVDINLNVDYLKLQAGLLAAFKEQEILSLSEQGCQMLNRGVPLFYRPPLLGKG